MAGTAIIQLRESGSGTSESTYQRHVRVYMVTVDDRTDDATDINDYLDANSFTLGAAHPNYASALLTTRDVTRMGDNAPFQWRVELTYETPSGSSDPDANPLTRDPVVVWQSSIDQKLLPYDYSATRTNFVNTAGEPYEDPPMALFASWELSYTRNEANLSAVMSFIGQDTLWGNTAFVNSGSFNIDGQTIGAKHALMWVESAQKFKENGTNYYAVTYRFLFKTGPTGGWRPNIAQYGYSELVASVPTEIFIKGSPISLPWPLDSAGAKKTNRTDDPAEVEYVMYKEVSFTSLGFS